MNDTRRVRVVFDREKYESAVANVEQLKNFSMEDDLDIRVHDYLYRVEQQLFSVAEAARKAGFKSVTFLGTKKDDRPILL